MNKTVMTEGASRSDGVASAPVGQRIELPITPGASPDVDLSVHEQPEGSTRDESRVSRWRRLLVSTERLGQRSQRAPTTTSASLPEVASPATEMPAATVSATANAVRTREQVLASLEPNLLSTEQLEVINNPNSRSIDVFTAAQILGISDDDLLIVLPEDHSNRSNIEEAIVLGRIDSVVKLLDDEFKKLDFKDRFISYFRAKDDTEKKAALEHLLSLFGDDADKERVLDLLKDHVVVDRVLRRLEPDDADDGKSINNEVGPAPENNDDSLAEEENVRGAIEEAIEALSDRELPDDQREKIRTAFKASLKKYTRRVIYTLLGFGLPFFVGIMLSLLIIGTKGGGQSS